ncbi:MAG: cytochrome c [Pseudomonadota bacterium]
MTIFPMRRWLPVLLVALVPVVGHAAGDAEAGKAKAVEKTCNTCHGDNGISVASTFPNLAGQYADYLENALKQYASGKRKNAIMAQFATGLSPQDMKDLAAWYSSQAGLGTVPKTAAD